MSTIDERDRSAQFQAAAARRQTETALEATTRKFEVMFAATSDGIALVNLQGKIVEVNDAYCRMSGYSREELTGVPISALEASESSEEIARRIRKILEGGHDRFETRHRGKDGSIFDVDISALHLDIDGGRIAMFARDITERKRSEARLKADLTALQRMYALSGRVLGTAGIQPLLQEVMEAAVEIMGAERGTLQLLEGDSLRIVAHRGHQPPFLEFFTDVENRTPVCGEAMRRGQRVVVPDIETSPLFAGTPSLAVLREAGVRAAQSTPVASRGGELLGVLTTHWGAPHSPDEHDLWRLDLLARQAADLIEHARAEAALHSLVQFPEEIPNLVLRIAHGGALLYANAAARAFLAEMGGGAGQPVPAAVRALVDRVLHGEREVEAELGSEGGRTFWLGAVQPEGHSYVNLYGRDITERKRIEKELAEQARLKDEFLALLGHELRNPLAAISTVMHLLSSGVTAERRASLDEMIGRQVKVLERLVDDLLDLARVTHGQIELKKEPIDLSEFLQRAAAAVHSSVVGREQELVVKLPPQRVLFMADGVRLEQIATNLLSNASKYTGHGGRIELSGAKDDPEIVIRCKDSGRGIPVEMQQTIFEPFRRVEMPGQDGETGIGIGLALVKRLVELHGGTVSVASGGPGTGSEFMVRLPLVEPAPATQVPAQAAPAPRPRRRLSIVLVEDNPDLARSMAMGLERAGHRVTLFADGPAALSGLSRLKPHAVLLDIGLPGMDGYELAAKLRKKQNLRHALFVGLSGFERRPKPGDAGDDFDHYFVKPLDPDKLLALLERETGVRKQGRTPKECKALRVLVVEDNAGLAVLMAEMLQREGLEARTALSGREALEIAPDFRPQLALCDLHLPDMPGQEVVRGLRSAPATQGTHAVILTALTEWDLRVLRRRAKEMGVDEFISKPFTHDKLRAVLGKLKRPRG